MNPQRYFVIFQDDEEKEGNYSVSSKTYTSLDDWLENSGLEELKVIQLLPENKEET
jgi:hypothetical protein